MHHFKKVAVLCAQKKGVYSQSAGIVGHLTADLFESDRQLDQVKNQSIDRKNQFSCDISQIVDVDLWDAKRDAFKFTGGAPVVAHPPCRLWAGLKGLAKSPDAETERELGRHCVRMVMECGGVLEHPADSGLFAEMGLPRGGYANEKGFTLELTQRIFGHAMMKPTWFFFSGINYNQVLPIVPVLHFSPLKQIHHLSSAQREATPPALAKWLLYHAAISKKESK